MAVSRLLLFMLGALVLVQVLEVYHHLSLARDFDTVDEEECLPREAIVANAESGSMEEYPPTPAGFVSMCWQLVVPGRTLERLLEVTARLGKDALLPGDALHCPGKGVVLFVGWAQGQKLQYEGFEFTQSGVPMRKTFPYPYYEGEQCYRPIRFDGVC